MCRRMLCYKNIDRAWSAVRVLLIWKIVIRAANTTEIYGNLPDKSIISKILNEFVAPMMRSLPVDSPLFRTFKDNTVKKAINERISELHQYLQDDDRNVFDEDNFLLEGNDETAIIEFLPKTDMTSKNDTNYILLKNNIKKYKKIREKIKESLTEESVSEKTKTFVLKTLDDLSKELIHGRCSGKSMRSEQNQEPYLIANKWNEGWRHIKNTFFSFLTSNFRKSSDIPKYIDNLHVLLKKISKDADLISKKYKIQCEFIPKISYLSTESSNPLRLNWDSTELEDRCQRTIICSNELKDFMFKFYQTLNDTTVSVLKNYEEMYTREVSADDAREKQLIISLLARASDDVKTAVKDVYLKEIKKFKLHEGKKHEANINLISEFIKRNIENVKEKIRKMLRARLSNVRDKVAVVIKDDMKVNLDVDLGNVEQEFIKRICAAFRLCNGKYAGRRQNEESGVDKNNVLVQVQLSLDADPEFRRFLNNETDDKSTKVTAYSPNINITRTTTFSSIMRN